MYVILSSCYRAPPHVGVLCEDHEPQNLSEQSVFTKQNCIYYVVKFVSFRVITALIGSHTLDAQLLTAAIFPATGTVEYMFRIRCPAG